MFIGLSTHLLSARFADADAIVFPYHAIPAR